MIKGRYARFSINQNLSEFIRKLSVASNVEVGPREGRDYLSVHETRRLLTENSSWDARRRP